MPFPLPSCCKKLHSPDNTVASLLSGDRSKVVSVICTVLSGSTWPLLPQPRITPLGFADAASHCPFGPGFEEITIIAPDCDFLPVSGFPVRSETTDNVLKP